MLPPILASTAGGLGSLAPTAFASYLQPAASAGVPASVAPPLFTLSLPLASTAYPFLPPELNIWWLTLIGLSLSLGLAIAGIAYMIGDFLNSPQLKAWVKNELYETWVSFLIVGLAVAGIVVMNTLMVSFTGGYDPFMLGDVFLSAMLARLSEVYVGLLKYEVIMGVFSTLGVSIPIPEPWGTALMIGFTPLAGVSLLVEAHTMLVDFIGLAYSLVLGQQIVLGFIKETMLTIFLPLGILLRAFPLTRKTGSTIIGVAIIAYMVYPLTLMFNQEIMKYTRPLEFRSVEEVATMCSAEPPPDTGFVLSEVSSKSSNPLVSLLGHLRNIVYGSENEEDSMFAPPKETAQPWYHPFVRAFRFITDIAVKFVSVIASVYIFVHVWLWALLINPKLYAFAMYEHLLADLNIVTQFLGLAIIFPVIDIIICVSLYRNLAGVLGGEEQIFGLAKIT